MEKYQVLYADPPWDWKTYSPKGLLGTSPQKHYDVMKIKDIINLSVQQIAADDSILFLWATFPLLPEALKVMKYWGFQYRTVAFVWVKKCHWKDKFHTGNGYYTRSNAELCLLGRRGNGLKRISGNIHQIICTHVEEHSKKPDETRIRIEKLFGNVKRIELFARDRKKGWDCFGNEVDSDLKLIGNTLGISGTQFYEDFLKAIDFYKKDIAEEKGDLIANFISAYEEMTKYLSQEEILRRFGKYYTMDDFPFHK